MISNVNKKNFSTTETILQQLRNDINNLHYNDQLQKQKSRPVFK